MNKRNLVVSLKRVYSKSSNRNLIPDLNEYKPVEWMFDDIKDCSALYCGVDYSHSDDLCSSFLKQFGLKRFRPHQFEAINAALLRHNCFILMPTGGGKSLIYQLPAVLSKRITLVVSPLKSLIIDQVEKMKALKIPVAHLITQTEKEVQETNDNQVYEDLNDKNPKLRLLYITPEKLGVNARLKSVLTNLYSRDLIERFVIDEAHCVSMWGHDFRIDYTKLGAVRNSLFPTVPIMLLTATATSRVRKDILLQMKQTATNHNDWSFFLRSFNRDNLKYSVLHKSNEDEVLDKILNKIKSKFLNQCGIVYCISRKRCEEVAEYLCANGLEALAYHAEMDDSVRNEVQRKWTNNECNIVCATIAFGMGIDKADVRFVIHSGLPKSLEALYQESGRAGRDGRPSSCILYYNHYDIKTWLSVIMSNKMKSPALVFKQHEDNLYRVAQYCMNKTDCRNSQILEYFGERFDRNKCMDNKKSICDNCLAYKKNAFVVEDVTEEAISIVDTVNQFECNSLRLSVLCDILVGKRTKDVLKHKGHELETFGDLSIHKKEFIERIVYKLIQDGYLCETNKAMKLANNKRSVIVSSITVEPKAEDLRSGKDKIEIDAKKMKEKKRNVEDRWLFEDGRGCIIGEDVRK